MGYGPWGTRSRLRGGSAGEDRGHDLADCLVIMRVRAAEVQVPGGDLAEASAEVYRRVVPDQPVLRQFTPGLDAYSAIVDKVADGIRSSAFGDPEQWRFDWERVYTRDEWLDLQPTFGVHSQIPPEKAGELLAGIGAAVDTVGGSFTMGYTTVVVTAELGSAA